MRWIQNRTLARRNALERALDYCTRFNIFFIYGIYASSSNFYVSVLLAERAENTETERRLHSALQMWFIGRMCAFPYIFQETSWKLFLSLCLKVFGLSLHVFDMKATAKSERFAAMFAPTLHRLLRFGSQKALLFCLFEATSFSFRAFGCVRTNSRFCALSLSLPVYSNQFPHSRNTHIWFSFFCAENSHPSGCVI